jgi:DNA-binding transcriptional ArsR family regulator
MNAAPARYHVPATKPSTDSSPLERLRAAHRLPASALADPAGGRTYRASVAVRKAVLLVLAERANADGWCFLRVRTIAAETGYTDRAVRLALDALEAHGWVRREATTRDDGRSQSANSYRVDWAQVMAADGGQPRPRAVDNPASPGTRFRPPLNQVQGPPLNEVQPKKGVKNLKEEDLEGRPSAHATGKPPTPTPAEVALRALGERDPALLDRLLSDAEYDCRQGNRIPSLWDAPPAVRERILARAAELLAGVT